MNSKYRFISDKKITKKKRKPKYESPGVLVEPKMEYVPTIPVITEVTTREQAHVCFVNGAQAVMYRGPGLVAAGQLLVTNMQDLDIFLSRVRT